MIKAKNRHILCFGMRIIYTDVQSCKKYSFKWRKNKCDFDKNCMKNYVENIDKGLRSVISIM